MQVSLLLNKSKSKTQLYFIFLEQQFHTILNALPYVHKINISIHFTLKNWDHLLKIKVIFNVRMSSLSK